MKNTLRTTIVCLAIASIAIAATPNAKRLTPEIIAALTAPSDAPKAKGFKVEVSGLDHPGSIFRQPLPPPASKEDPISVTLPADKPQAVLECIREFKFPIEFSPPEVAAKGTPATVVPIIPTAFEIVNTGWTIRLSAKPHGKLIAVYAIADYVEAEMIPGGYGAIAGPIYSEQGEVLSPNRLDQPKFQTTTTRFHIFALPGEPYEVTLYRGAKAEKHTVTVTTE